MGNIIDSITNFFTGSTASAAEAVSASGADAQQPSVLMTMLPLILIIAVFYFLIIRPQQKKMREHQKMIKGIIKGDEVITSGGIIGKVAKVEEDTAYIEIAPNVTIKVKKDMLIHVAHAGKTTNTADKDEKSEKKHEESHKQKKGKK